MARVTRQLPETWVQGEVWSEGRVYRTLNPPVPKVKPATRKPPVVEADVTYGPFLIRCFYTQARSFAPVRKFGYVLLHPDGWGWYRTIFATVPDARGLGAEFAHSLNGIGGSPLAVLDDAADSHDTLTHSEGG